jgi:hypothetical protein
MVGAAPVTDTPTLLLIEALVPEVVGTEAVA